VSELTVVTTVPQSSGVHGVARTLFLAGLVALAGLAGPGWATAGTWCGNDVVAANRLPESSTGKQIHVVYAFPADGEDRFAALADAIVSDMEAIDGWWRGEDPTRTLRFDLFPFPGCAPGLGRLDLTRAQLPRAASQYAANPVTLDLIATDLASPQFALDAPYAKYLVYYDGPTNDVTCGQGYRSGELGGRAGYAAVYVRSCEQKVGTGGVAAWAAAHELGHSLGAVASLAPNECEWSWGHACDHSFDLMRPINFGDPLAKALLDHGRNDYYGHPGDWPDVRDSGWLMRLDQPRHRLQVALTGSTGGGRVVSVADPGIACPLACGGDWDGGSTVELAVVEGANDRFMRWRGDCTGVDPVCTLVIDRPRAATAVLGPAIYRLTVNVVGRGTVRTSDGDRCARRCALVLEPGSAVRLRSIPGRGYRFVRWSGSCRGSSACVVRGTAHRSVTAVFRRR
jgi:hypothetical protein